MTLTKEEKIKDWQDRFDAASEGLTDENCREKMEQMRDLIKEKLADKDNLWYALPTIKVVNNINSFFGPKMQPGDISFWDPINRMGLKGKNKCS